MSHTNAATPVHHPLAGPWTDLGSTRQALRSFESDFIGVCNELVELTYADDDVRSFYAGAGTAQTREILGSPANSENGGGAFSQTKTIDAAIGETVERYSAAYIPYSNLHKGTARDFGSGAIDPQQTTLFADWQYEDDDFRFKAFKEDTELHWVEAYDLRANTTRLIPAQICYLSDAFAHRESRITYATSNGLACGPTRREALASGLLELVERDPLMIAWNAGLSLPIIDWTTSDQLNEVFERHFLPSGLTIDAVDLSSFLNIPTALGVVRNQHSDVGALALGASSRPTLEDAVIEALLEAHQSRTWCRTQQITEPRIEDDDIPNKIVDFEHHVRFYGERDRAQLASFLTESTETVPANHIKQLNNETPRALVSDVLSRLPDHIEVFAVDLTSPDVGDAGLHVVKVYSPQLQPLDVGWRNRFLGGERLYSVPFDMGFTYRPLNRDDLTPIPHPFP